MTEGYDDDIWTDGEYGGEEDEEPEEHAGPADRRERTFAALPPIHGRGFANTWWGQAWLRALEDTALDGERLLKRGRKHAREGAVGAVSVRPGRITAVVRDRDGTSHRADVLVQELDGAAWDRLLGVVAERAGHIAALLDRDMPPHLAEDAAAAGVELLPGIGDLEPECACEAWDHCPHTAALCYQVARLLDQDPFVLLLMRGRGERELLDELQARSVAHGAARAAEEADAVRGAAAARPEGVPAAEAFAAAAQAARPPLPGPPPAELAPGRPPGLDGADPAAGLDPAALEFLAADAAARAHRLLREALSPDHGTTPPPAGLTVWQDAVRMVAAADSRAPITARISARLVEGCGRDRPGLGRAVRAWQLGGAPALAVLEEEWAPGPEELARARDRLATAWAEDDRPPTLRATGNRWTAVGTDTQLRYGPDGRWWPYRKEHGTWWPAGPGDTDPAAALATLLT